MTLDAVYQKYSHLRGDQNLAGLSLLHSGSLVKVPLAKNRPLCLWEQVGVPLVGGEGMETQFYLIWLTAVNGRMETEA